MKKLVFSVIFFSPLPLLASPGLFEKEDFTPELYFRQTPEVRKDVVEGHLKIDQVNFALQGAELSPSYSSFVAELGQKGVDQISQTLEKIQVGFGYIGKTLEDGWNFSRVTSLVLKGLQAEGRGLEKCDEIWEKISQSMPALKSIELDIEESSVAPWWLFRSLEKLNALPQVETLKLRLKQLSSPRAYNRMPTSFLEEMALGLAYNKTLKTLELEEIQGKRRLHPPSFYEENLGNVFVKSNLENISINLKETHEKIKPLLMRAMGQRPWKKVKLHLGTKLRFAKTDLEKGLSLLAEPESCYVLQKKRFYLCEEKYKGLRSTLGLEEMKSKENHILNSSFKSTKEFLVKNFELLRKFFKSYLNEKKFPHRHLGLAVRQRYKGYYIKTFLSGPLRMDTGLLSSKIGPLAVAAWHLINHKREEGGKSMGNLHPGFLLHEREITLMAAEFLGVLYPSVLKERPFVESLPKIESLVLEGDVESLVLEGNVYARNFKVSKAHEILVKAVINRDIENLEFKYPGGSFKLKSEFFKRLY